MIQSLLRAMELLELLKEANHKYSIAELSESTGLPPSTIHRILQTFCEKKYVIRDEHAHTYQLGPALISLGRAAADNVRIQDAALPILKNLSYCTREDSYLIIQVGDKGLVLDKTDGPNHLKVVEEFGYEMDLMKMSEEDKKTAREQILKYKEMEHLVQSGDYYRLVNPFENNNHVLWQFVSKDKKETVVCGVRLHSEANPYIYLFYPQGLDADLHYEDIATGKVYTGAALMKAGLPLPLTTGDYQPIRFTFKAVEK